MNICRFWDVDSLPGLRINKQYQPKWYVHSAELVSWCPNRDYPSQIQLLLNKGLCEFILYAGGPYSERILIYLEYQGMSTKFYTSNDRMFQFSRENASKRTKFFK